MLAATTLGLAPTWAVAVGPALASPEAPTSPSALGPSYATYEIAGADFTDVTGVNDAGVVAGYYGDGTGQHGFLDDQGTIVTVDGPAGSERTVVTSINDAGSVTGAYWIGAKEYGFVADATGAIVSTLDDWGAVPAGYELGTFPSGINDAGVVVGYTLRSQVDAILCGDIICDSTMYHGFVWSADTGFTTYDAPGAGTDATGYPMMGTRLLGLNDAGDLVGSYTYLQGDFGETPGFELSGVTVTATGVNLTDPPVTFTVIRDPVLPQSWCGETIPTAVNDQGVVVGNAKNGCAPAYWVFVVANGVYTVVDGYSSGSANTATEVNSVNEHGVVGGAWRTWAPGPNDAAVYGPDHGLTGALNLSWVSGTVHLAGPIPSGTTSGVTACPQGQPFGSTCAGGTTVPAGASGAYVVTLVPGEWNLAAFVQPGGSGGQRVYTTPVTVSPATGQTLTSDFLVTAPSGTVTGTVKPSGPFYPGTEYGARACPSSQPFSATCVDEAQVLTDASGHYALTLSPGSWNVAGFAWPAGSAAQEVVAATQAAVVTQGGSVTRNFTVASPSGSVSGSVKPAGPFPSGTAYGVRACPSVETFGLTCTDGATTTTDASGRYALTLPPGSWTLAGLAWPGGTSQVLTTATKDVAFAAGQTVPASFVVASPYGAVSGTVTPAGPVPPSSSYGVLACPAGQPVTFSCNGRSITYGDTAGRYAAVLTPGTWNVEGVVWTSGAFSMVLTGSPATVSLGSGQTLTRNLTVPTPFVVVTASVKLSGAFPAGTRYGALACPAGQAVTLSCSYATVAYADTSGRASLVVLPGSWRVAALAWLGGSGYPLIGSPSGVTVSSGKASSVTVALTSPYGEVAGTVKASGPFPAGTTYGVVACRTFQPFSLSCTTLTRADADGSGHYSLVLDPGMWNVAGVAWAGGSGGQPVLAPARTLTVSAGGSVPWSFVVASPFGGVSGTVKPGGTFPSGAVYGVLACPSGQPLAVSCTSAAFAYADGSGHYALTVTPGTWQVAGFAWLGVGQPTLLTAPTSLTLASGQSLSASFVVPAPTYTYVAGATSGPAGTTVTVGAVLFGIANNPVAGEPITFTLGSATCTGTTDGTGRAFCSLTTPASSATLFATFAGDNRYSGSSTSAPFSVF